MLRKCSQLHLLLLGVEVTKMTLSEDSLAIILLCSNFLVSKKVLDTPKPLTIKEWDTISTKLRNSLLERPKAFFHSSPNEWRENLELNNEQIERIQRLLAQGGQLGVELDRLKSLGIWVTTRAETNYPSRFKKILREKSPTVLYGAGDITLCNDNLIAIVGSRDVDNDGVLFAESLGKKCASESLGVVSGGSRGVDSIAQGAALSRGGRVVSVLSEGLESSTLKREIRSAIASGKLLLLSAWHPKSGFKFYNALERNKHIYSLSNYSVVVSSAEKGGTWSGATQNLKNNWVPLFVRSGECTPSGNNKLIEMGGIPLEGQLLTDKNVPLKDWFFEKATNSSTQTTTLRKQAVNNSKYQIQLKFENNSNDDNQNKFSDCNLDLFKVVWPYMQKLLETPKNVSELAELLNIRDVQIQDWLKTALDNGKVEELSEQGKYINCQM